MLRRLPWALILFLFTCLTCRAADWQVVYEQTFDSATMSGWQISGASVVDGALVTSGQESTAKLERVFDAPAVRVSYDAKMLTSDVDGKVSDLSCFVGDVFFRFGGAYNGITQINRASVRTRDFGSRIKMGKAHHVVAEVNGAVARLSIDGAVVGEQVYDARPNNLAVTLYAWSGVARFDNLRVETATEADSIPVHLAAALAYGSQTEQTLKHLRDWPLPKLSPERKSPVSAADVPLVVDFGSSAKPGMVWPITCGVPLARGALFNPDHAMVVDADGNEIPSQRTVTATWSERGSIRWLLLDFLLPVTERRPQLYLRYGNDVRPMQINDGLRIVETADTITVDGGAAQFTISKTRGTVLESASLNAKQVLGQAEAYYNTKQGWHYTTNNSDELDVKIEMAGPIRSVVRSRGWYTDKTGRRACYFTRRLYIYKGLPWARLFTTWTVTVDTRAYTFTDMGVTFKVVNGKSLDDPITVLAADRHKGFVITGDNRLRTTDVPQDITSGGRGRGGGGGVSIGCFEMNRQWPAALSTDGRSITFHGFSSLAGLDLDMTDVGLRKLWGATYDRFNAARGTYLPIAERNPNGLGLAKTHELIIALHPEADATPRDALDTFQQPPMVAADSTHVCSTGVVGPGEYHPYDKKQFASFEASIEQQRDELLDVLERVEPWYGFWDYGAGVPHHMKGDLKGDGPVTYNGYRRCYDVGYQQPLVPWQMYWRSAQRKWLTFARRTARCLMDSRVQHWTDPTLGKQIGHVTQDHGTWAWDSNLAGFGFNAYTPALLMDYYTTGNERAMDVHTEVLDAYCKASGSAYYYMGATGNWLGNTADAYRATWEPHYRKIFQDIQRYLVASVCGLCGGVKANRHIPDEKHDHHGTIHRNGWVEYGILHALQVDDHNPAIRDILVRNGAKRYATKGYTTYAVMAGARLMAYRALKDKRIAREGRDLLDYYMRDGHGTLLTFSGLSYMRAIPMLMRLVAESALDDVTVPTRMRIAPPLVVRHEQDKATQVVIETRQKITLDQAGITVRDSRGGAVQGQFDPILGRFTLQLEADVPSADFHIDINRPRLFNGDLDALAWVTCDPATKIAVAIPHGYHHFRTEPLPKLWFRVPPGTKQFRVRNNVSFRSITITRPDGWTYNSTGEWHTVDVPPGLPDWPWSLESEGGGHANFQCVKLYDVPALVSMSREAVFAMDNPPMPVADYEPGTGPTAFLPGVFGQALHLNGRDELRIPLGEKTDKHSRKRLTTRRGTIEFFFKLNAEPYFAQAAGLPMQLRPDDSAPFKNWSHKWLSLNHKNALVMLMPDGRQLAPVRFGPWDKDVGMIEFKPGEWHHLAIVWDASKVMDVHGSPKAVTQLRTFLDGRNLSTGTYDQPHWLFDAHSAPLPADVFEWISEGHDVLIDELRVSDVERVPYPGPNVEVHYPVPQQPYSVDENTLMLLHFDGDQVGLGRGGDVFNATFQSSP